jgi:hypothetical protein
MKNYIKDWHEVHYGDKCKCEIIEKIELWIKENNVKNK